MNYLNTDLRFTSFQVKNIFFWKTFFEHYSPQENILLLTKMYFLCDLISIRFWVISVYSFIKFPFSLIVISEA